MRVLVCGGRNYGTKASEKLHINLVLDEITPTFLICGGCRGADTEALAWADRQNVNRIVHYANWQDYGRFAGPLRNQEMLDKEKPDLVVAFPGGKGTDNMVSLARKAHVEVRDERRTD